MGTCLVGTGTYRYDSNSRKKMLVPWSPMWSPPARLLLAMSRQPRHQRRRAEGHDHGRGGHVEGEAQSIAEGQELGGVEVHLGKSWKTMGKIVIFDEKTMGQLLILSENYGENCHFIGKP